MPHWLSFGHGTLVLLPHRLRVEVRCACGTVWDTPAIMQVPGQPLLMAALPHDWHVVNGQPWCPAHTVTVDEGDKA